MAKLTAFLELWALLLVLLPPSSAGNSHQLGWYSPPEMAACGGSVGECVDMEMEMEMDSEINRRMLAAVRRYISYGALRRNIVPCRRSGASYYNCRRGAPANPYHRGCSAITRCRH
ncbi:rapid alkalinization factor-like [Diospyros lotus]|uniref:rapid alkalinization factor-like n=1 Tax=Diospyros lotus TaxID=55363 RepID=UPI002254872C|nr:rapid alkalinization factor-like [Diospyros lotus]